MRTRRWAPLALLVVVAVTAGGCGGGTKKVAGESLPVPVFPAGTAMAAIQSKGRLVVGTKFDQPGFGQKNPTNGKVEGFDVEIAKLMAVGIFGGNLSSAGSKIQYVEAVSKNREPFLQNRNVDIVVATYTINPARKQVVDFGGPYFEAHQDIMVKKGDDSIKSVTDLNGKKVCTAKGSTSEKNLRAQAPQADLSTLFDTYSQCAEALTDGRVAAVSTDSPILAGLVQAGNGTFKLVDKPFTDEPYGIGLKKGDAALKAFINQRLIKIEESGEWRSAFARTLGRLGLPTPEPPHIDTAP